LIYKLKPLSHQNSVQLRTRPRTAAYWLWCRPMLNFGGLICNIYRSTVLFNYGGMKQGRVEVFFVDTSFFTPKCSILSIFGQCKSYPLSCFQIIGGGGGNQNYWGYTFL